MKIEAATEGPLSEITESFGINWPFFLAQLLPIAVVFGLFVLAARAILMRGRGWEVPVWLLLSLFIPVIFPICALVYFRKSKENEGGVPMAAK